MLHAAPTSETKTDTAQSKTQVVPQPERELHPRLLSPAGLYSQGEMSGVASGASPDAQRRQALAGMQNTHGNQAVLRMLHSPQRVARMTALRPSQGIMLQRKCACGGSAEAEGECAECKAEREATLQRRAANASPASTNGVPPIVHNVLRSPGQPLDTGTRAFMEPRFGHDFSQVRVHTDARAAESARAVNALAYTVGRDVVFGAGQYGWGTSEGRQLMAHELTHIMQQSGAATGTPMPSSLAVNEPNDIYEQEAERYSWQVTQDSTPSPIQPEIGSYRQHPVNLLQRKMSSDENLVSLPTSGGTAIQEKVRKNMEERFGTSFSNVRIHTDKESGATALAMGAQAFTHGQDIHFAPNRYQPGTQNGFGLLAHELTHVVQQRNGRFIPNMSSGRTVSTHNSLENEAQSVQQSVRSSSRQLQVREADTENVIHRSLLDDLQALVFNNLDDMVDFILSHIEIDNDRIMSKLNQLRIEIKKSKRRFIRLEMKVAADCEALFNRLRRFAPRWMPVPNINFGGPPTQQAAVLIAIPIGVIILFILFIIAMVWLLMRQNPDIRRQQDEAIERVIDRIRDALKAEPEEDVETQSKPQEQPQPQPRPRSTVDLAPPRPRCRSRLDPPCPTQLLIDWPTLLPNPKKWPNRIPSFEENGLMRSGSDVRDSSGIGVRSGKAQKNFAKRIKEALSTGADLPTPCFEDDVPLGPSDKFHAHHIHPLFLGGGDRDEGEENLCAIHLDRHVDGHPLLDDQTENFDEYVRQCNMCSPFLKNHPEEQTYAIRGSE